MCLTKSLTHRKVSGFQHLGLQAGNAHDSLLPSEGFGAKGPANLELGWSQPQECAGFQHTVLTETPLSEKWIWKKSFFDSLGCSLFQRSSK